MYPRCCPVRSPNSVRSSPGCETGGRQTADSTSPRAPRSRTAPRPVQAGARPRRRRSRRRGAARGRRERHRSRAAPAARHRRARRRGRGHRRPTGPSAPASRRCTWGATASPRPAPAGSPTACGRRTRGQRGLAQTQSAGHRGGRAAAELIAAASCCARSTSSRQGSTRRAHVPHEALLAADTRGRRIERLFVGGNPRSAGAVPLAALIVSGAVGELYASATRLGDEGAQRLADALGGAAGRLPASPSPATASVRRRCPSGRRSGHRRLELLDMGRVRAAGTLGAEDNLIDTEPRRPSARASPMASTGSPTSSSRTPGCAAARPTASSTPRLAP